MARMSRREADEYSARVSAALERVQVSRQIWQEASTAEKRAAYAKLGAYHVLKLARHFGIKPPKDLDARERFNYGAAVQKALGI